MAIRLFEEKLKEAELWPLRPSKIEIFQINVGKLCNQTCHHCHVDAGPTRKEIMSRETMDMCLHILKEYKFPIVDLTGGAPEMNPHFRWFVTELKSLGCHVIDRCNLTILVAHEKYKDLPYFFRDHQVEVVSSLPHYSPSRTDRQRGDGVFTKSIRALKLLNDVGYGKPDTNLKLNLVYNPTGCFLPGDQAGLEHEFKTKLKSNHDIEFNHLFCITNMPIKRYLDYLHKSGNYNDYMTTLVNNFNAAAARGVMCRNTISVSWDGKLYDCDFNQMLEMPVDSSASQTLSTFNLQTLEKRNIVTADHCFGCTAGSGSSCGGTTA